MNIEILIKELIARVVTLEELLINTSEQKILYKQRVKELMDLQNSECLKARQLLDLN